MRNLASEIDQIKDKVDPDTWESIEAVRKVGNIGAHMEKDVDLIVEVDEREASLLIELIESLFEDWYVDRFKREQRNKRMKAMAEDKDQKRSGVQGVKKPNDTVEAEE